MREKKRNQTTGNCHQPADIWEDSQSLNEAFERLAQPLLKEKEALKKENERLKLRIDGLDKLILNLKKQVFDTNLSLSTFHDLNNLLVAIIGNASMILSGYQVSPAIDKYVRSLLFAGEQCRDLIVNAREILQRGNTRKISVNVNVVIMRVSRLLNTSLELDLDKADPIIVINKAEFARIILNLIKNASEALGENGSIRVSTAVIKTNKNDDGYDNVFADDKRGRVLITVSDTGCGMDKQTQHRAFDIDFSTKNNHLKRGLGLPLVRELVEGNGGRITLNSWPGKGTSFYVSFPVTV